MSTKELEMWLSKVKELSADELLSAQERIATELKQKTTQSQAVTQNFDRPTQRLAELQERLTIPGAYRPTKEQIEAHLSAVFTPQQRAEIEKVDLSGIKLPPGLKSSAELISEDREDRF